MNIKNLLMVAAIVPLASCASAAAANKTGVDIEKVAECTTQSCVYGQQTAEKVNEKKLANGLTQYAYRMQKRQGSYIRSLGYGLAAVGTLGLSEIVAGTAEGAIQNDKQFVAVIDCDANGECPRMVIQQFEKNPIIVRGHTPAEKAAEEAAAAEAEAAKKKS